MKPTIQSHLKFLYGPRQAAQTEIELAALAGQWRERLPRQAHTRAEWLTEKDALLITYADQVREPDRAPLQTLADFAAQHLQDVVSGVHILPFYPWSSDDGFSVKDFFAVDPAFGTWDDIARLRTHFDLMLDAVFNHMSAQGEWFQRFLAGDPQYRDFFVTVEGQPDLSQVVRPRAGPLLTEFQTASEQKKVWTTFGADQVDLNFKNPAVLLAALRALLFYLEQGAKFIRLDAIAYLWKESGTSCIHLPQTHRVIQLMRAVLDEVAPHMMLITETNVPHRDNISYFGDGTDEARLVYNFSLPPLTLHSLQTGDATALTRWAQSLTLPSERVTWFNFLASHDGVGVNPARGILSEAEIEALVARTLAHGGFVSFKRNSDGSESPYEMNISYIDALSNPAAGEPPELAARKFLTAQAIMLSLQGVPGIYFHSLFGSRGDRAGVDASGIKRRINRQKLQRAGLENELSDPASLRALIFGGYRELLRVRRGQAAFHPSAPQHVLDLDPRVFAVLRETKDRRERVLCLHNVSAAPVTCRTSDVDGEGKVTLLFGKETGSRTTDGSQELQPYETRWLRLS
jgi:sucrose phosphorylase